MTNKQKLALLIQWADSKPELEHEDKMKIDGLLNSFPVVHLEIAYGLDIKYISALAGNKLKDEHGYSQAQLNAIPAPVL